MNVYTKNDYKILKNIMDRNDETKGRSRNKGTTVKEICDKTGLSYNKVRLTLKMFLEDGFVGYGVALVKTKTFYITEDGLIELKSLDIVSLKGE